MAPVVLLLHAFSCGAAVGESAVITLVFPYGARMRGMGEVGTALADDECMIFTNPAGLGQPLERWRYGAQSFAYERLLPEFKLPDLWHAAHSFVFRPQWRGWSEDIGGFCFSWNYINFGGIELTDDQGRVEDTTYSWEGVWTLGWGIPLPANEWVSHYAGASVKWVHSALAPEYGVDDDGIGRVVAFDAGYLVDFYPGIRFGLSLQNMGPPIYYISTEHADPIPFTINLACAFKGHLDIDGVRSLAIAAEYRADREFVKNRFDGRPDPFWKAIRTDWADSDLEENMEEIIHHWGAEITAINTFSSRFGFMKDAIGYRTELSWGVGAHWLNHFNLDFGVIYSPDGMSVARHGQWHFSFSVHDLWCWDRKRDFEWWRVVDET